MTDSCHPDYHDLGVHEPSQEHPRPEGPQPDARPDGRGQERSGEASGRGPNVEAAVSPDDLDPVGGGSNAANAGSPAPLAALGSAEETPDGAGGPVNGDGRWER